jgi:hypothetical protein
MGPAEKEKACRVEKIALPINRDRGLPWDRLKKKKPVVRFAHFVLYFFFCF